MGAAFSRTKRSELPDDAALPANPSLKSGNQVADAATDEKSTAGSTGFDAAVLELPADLALILETGAYKDEDESSAAAGKSSTTTAKPGQSIQDAVRDLKAKYRINSTSHNDKEEGELEDVRAELAQREGNLKAALAAARAKKMQTRTIEVPRSVLLILS